ncbi:MAG: hypothetical protein ABIQ58_00400 [Candidatus Limnocylindrales bacterium]
MRRLLPIFLAMLLAMSAVASANALTVKRTWTAHVGRDSVYGTATLQAFTSGTGKLPCTSES